MSNVDTSAIIRVEEITKSYVDNDVPSVNRLSFQVPKGEVFGLLGPNGAGKTTTISILCGLIKPTSGKVLIFDRDIETDFKELKSRLGVVPQDVALYPTLTGRENLEFYGTMYGVEKDILQQRIDDWLSIFELKNKANKRVETYSGGMKRRLNLIAGVLHNPDVLFLDEPTVGVDVQSRAAIIEQLKALNNDGMTIVYTSHHMEEAQDFCTDVAIVDHGKLVTQGQPNELIDSYKNCKDLEDVFLYLTSKTLRD